ncbi:MAG: DUF443 family protein [Opitutaceae bacterium]
MKSKISRREFLEEMLPSKSAMRRGLYALLIGIGIIFAIIFLRETTSFATEITTEGWIFLAALTGIILVLRFLLKSYRRLKVRLRTEKKKEKLLLLLKIEILLKAILLVGFGSLMHSVWLDSPNRAYAMMTIALFFGLLDLLNKKSEPDGSGQ